MRSIDHYAALQMSAAQLQDAGSQTSLDVSRLLALSEENEGAAAGLQQVRVTVQHARRRGSVPISSGLSRFVLAMVASGFIFGSCIAGKTASRHSRSAFCPTTPFFTICPAPTHPPAQALVASQRQQSALQSELRAAQEAIQLMVPREWRSRADFAYMFMRLTHAEAAGYTPTVHAYRFYVQTLIPTRTWRAPAGAQASTSCSSAMGGCTRHWAAPTAPSRRRRGRWLRECRSEGQKGP